MCLHVNIQNSKMKRAHNKIEKKKPEYALVGWTGPVLPSELIQEIASHYRPENVLEIFEFIRICKSAMNALPLILRHWIVKLFHGVTTSEYGNMYSLSTPGKEITALLQHIRQDRKSVV